MSSINLHTDEIGIKVVYYGPGLGGKTTSLQFVHRALRQESRGQLISLATGIDRTLYFDFLPVKLPRIKGFTVRMSLYTVPGQVHYNATRKLVLQGADGVVFVADSQAARHDANLESIENLRENLRGQGMNPDTVPLVIQYNKRDLTAVLPLDRLERDLNRRGVPSFATSATDGQGVFDALKAITKLVLADLKRKGIYGEREREPEPGRERSSKPPSGEYEIATPPSSSERSGLAAAIEEHMELTGAAPAAKAAAAPSVPPSLADLWQPGRAADRFRELERALAAGDFAGAISGARGLLDEHLAETAGSGATTADALLVLGVHGAHWVRFLSALARPEPSRQDALICLFFLTDVELRMLALGARVVE
ncbi:MAG TPA: GTPase domain-containing protein [Polyangia bacterium]|nr:GTPase domain-containing protein [Polyangia bacterium]